MSNVLTDARNDIAAAITDAGIEGLAVWAYVPNGVVAPAAVVKPADPYLVPGRVMGEYEITLDVRLLLARGTNEVLTQVLDGLIVDVTNALRDAGFAVRQVSAPGMDRESYDTPYLVSDITINTTYNGGK